MKNRAVVLLKSLIIYNLLNDSTVQQQGKRRTRAVNNR